MAGRDRAGPGREELTTRLEQGWGEKKVGGCRTGGDLAGKSRSVLKDRLRQLEKRQFFPDQGYHGLINSLPLLHQPLQPLLQRKSRQSQWLCLGQPRRPVTSHQRATSVLRAWRSPLAARCPPPSKRPSF